LTRFDSARAREAIRYLESLGFAQARKEGRHKFFRHRDGRTAAIPDHRGEYLGRGILSKVLRDAGMAPQQFLAWLSR